MTVTGAMDGFGIVGVAVRDRGGPVARSQPQPQRLVVAGRIDVSTVAEVRQALHQALDDGSGDLVVDVAGVEIVDATGLGVLVGAHRRAARMQRRLVLAGAPPRLRRVLSATRLIRVLTLTAA